MSTYQIHYIDAKGFKVAVQIHTLADDNLAIAEATKRQTNHVIEIWDELRLVARIKGRQVLPASQSGEASHAH